MGLSGLKLTVLESWSNCDTIALVHLNVNLQLN